jgi:hypothetical protein
MKALFILLFFLPLFIFAQTKKQTVTYDVVHLKSGKVLYGKIVALDANYVLTFRDEYQRMYYLSKEMYEYIEEDRSFQKRVRNIDTLVKARKVDEWDFNIGLNTFFAGINAGFTPDEYYLSSNSNGLYFETPICLSIGAGKYFRQQHFIGLNLDVKALGGPRAFYQVAGQYHFQYDGYKTDVARYIPIQLGFQNLITTETFQVPDMTMPPMPNYLEKSYETMVKSYLLEIGHGWSFIGKDKHYWNLEFLIYKGILVKHGIITNDLFVPKLNYQTAGGQFKLSYHF